MPPFPDNGHLNAFDPGTVIAGKRGRCQHPVAWVDVHVVLFRHVVKVLDPGRDRIISIDDVDPIRDDVPRMGNPLAARHELVVRICSKTISHPSVIPSQANAGLHGDTQVLRFRIGNCSHRIDRHNQIEPSQIRVGECTRFVFLRDTEAVLDQELLNDLSAPFGLMAFPSTPDDQSSLLAQSKTPRFESGWRARGRSQRVVIETD